MKSELIYLGFALSDSIMKPILAIDPRPQVAAHKFQWALINGIEKSYRKPLKLICSVPVSHYPSYPKLVFRQRQDGRGNIEVGFINLTGLKHLTRLICTLTTLLSVFLGQKAKSKLIVYGLHSPHLVPALIVRFLFRCKVVVVIPDMPRFMDIGSSRTLFASFLKKIDVYLLDRILHLADGYVVLAEAIGNDFLKGKPYIVVEGIANTDKVPKRIPCEREMKRDSITLGYAGALKKDYGIELLISVVKELEHSRIFLKIFGRGPLESICEKAQQECGNIYFGGFLDESSLEKELVNVDLLANLRPPGIEISKYAFPSKIIDYMCHGYLVLSTRMESLPDDYMKHLIIVDDFSVQGVISSIKKFSDMDVKERIRLRTGAQSFIIKEKSSYAQGSRMLKFIESL